MSVTFTARTYIRHGFPPLRKSDEAHRVNTPSRSNYSSFSGNVFEWPNFEAEVRQFCTAHPPADVALSHHDPRSLINRESFLCAQEKGVEGRYSQAVMHVMAHCAQQSNLPLNLADFKAAETGLGNAVNTNLGTRGSEPDFVCVTANQSQNLRFIGECKADFRNTLRTDWTGRPPANGVIPGNSQIRNWLSQPMSYLIKYRLKYAFVTTYEYTFFMCMPTYVHSLEPRPEDNVWISQPIAWNDTQQSPAGVSVRECFWWLMNRALTDYRIGARRLQHLPEVSRSTQRNYVQDLNVSTDLQYPPGYVAPSIGGGGTDMADSDLGRLDYLDCHFKKEGDGKYALIAVVGRKEKVVEANKIRKVRSQDRGKSYYIWKKQPRKGSPEKPTLYKLEVRQKGYDNRDLDDYIKGRMRS